MAKPSPAKIKTINDKLYIEVAETLNLPLKLIKDVVINGQSKFTAVTMANNTFDGVRWPYFGSFKAKHKVVQVLQHMKGLDPAQKQFFKDMAYLKYRATNPKFKTLTATIEKTNKS